MRIILSLLFHGWLGFRRAHYFERSVGIRVLMVFFALMLLWYAQLAGRMMPSILQEFFPDKQVSSAFFSIWIYLFAADLLFRLSVQKLPRQMVRPYLHLPIERHILASWILVRSWFSIYNVYLFFLLLPFFRTLFPMPAEATLFWRALLAILLLAGLNHSINSWVKAAGDTRVYVKLGAIAGIGALLVAGLVFPGQFMAWSLRLGEGFLAGRWYVFALPPLFILWLQVLSQRALRLSMARLVGSARSRRMSGSSRTGHFLSGVPAYGDLWELEWQLITRNKRAANGLRQWPFVVVALPLFFHFDPFGNAWQYLYMMVMVAGGYGFYHLQYAFSWESRFFDLIITRPLNLERFVRAKYLFYVAMGLLTILPVLLAMAFLRPDLLWPLAGISAYTMGPVFAYLLYISINNSTRIDPDKRSTFNMEGTSGTMFLALVVTMLSVLMLMGVAYLLPIPGATALSLVTGVSGLLFMVTHRWWTAAIARKFLRRKYHHLNKYRE